MNDGHAVDDAPRTIGNGRYELLTLLGEGGMAAVWRAKDQLIGIERAVKILHPDVAERRSYRSRFLAEARTMGRFEHPNILRVFDVGEEDGRYWFTMEIVEGGALIDVLERQRKLKPLEALDITFQVLQALAAAHLDGIVHRDVKPDNILLSPDGCVRLSDFGIARIRHERVDHRTRTGVALGTVGYMAPEQRENARAVGPAADLYALGATLYAAMTGCEPPDLFASHLDPRLLAGIPPVARDLIRKATAYRPETRYNGARPMAVDVARAYDAIARGDGLPELGEGWLARFDALVADRVRQASVLPAPPAMPDDPDDLPPEAGGPTPKPSPRTETPAERAPTERTAAGRSSRPWLPYVVLLIAAAFLGGLVMADPVGCLAHAAEIAR